MIKSKLIHLKFIVVCLGAAANILFHQFDWSEFKEIAALNLILDLTSAHLVRLLSLRLNTTKWQLTTKEVKPLYCRCIHHKNIRLAKDAHQSTHKSAGLGKYSGTFEPNSFQIFQLE